MKSIFSKTALLLVISTALFSFSPKPGGEGFEVYLDNKLVLQQFGNKLNEVNELQLSGANSSSQLSIKYHHCGRVGKNRTVSIKDAQNNVLKQWRFTDTDKPSAAMTCKVSDILNLKKGNSTVSFKLYYSSSELPNGRCIASVVIPAKAAVMP